MPAPKYGREFHLSTSGLDLSTLEPDVRFPHAGTWYRAIPHTMCRIGESPRLERPDVPAENHPPLTRQHGDRMGRVVRIRAEPDLQLAP